MSLATGMALFFSAGAVCTDLFLEKVPNKWILLGLAAGAGYQDVLRLYPGRCTFFGISYFLRESAGTFFLFFPLSESL